VLVRSPARREIGLISASLGLSPAEFELAYYRARPDYDRGKTSTYEYWSAIAGEHRTRLSRARVERLRIADQEMWSRANRRMTTWLSALRRAGYLTAILSNMQPAMITHVRERFRWVDGVDQLLFSSEIGLVKPDPAIYRLCLERLGVSAQESLFVDDLEANVRAARSLGIAAIRFRSATQLARELRSIGFRPLPVVR
jgi:putative hydrolase of the HAD superfamily